MTGPFSHLFGSLPTAADLQRWEEDRERMTATITDLVQQRENLTRMIDLARSFVEPNLLRPTAAAKAEAADLKRSRSGRASKGSWTEALLSIAKANPDGISYDDAKIQLPAAFREIISRDPNCKSFYGALRRLDAEDGLIVRHNAHIFTPDGFRRYKKDVESGKRAAVVALASGGSPAGEEIINFLRAHGPHRAPIIKQHLAQFPDFEAVQRNSSQIYNILKSLKGKGDILHDEATGLYSVAQANEPPAELPLSGSEAGGAPTPPNENVVGFRRPH
jgi:hypothetical protein